MNDTKIRIVTSMKKTKQWMNGLHHQNKFKETLSLIKNHSKKIYVLFLMAASLITIERYIKNRDLQLIAMATLSGSEGKIITIPLGGNSEFQGSEQKNPIVRIIRPKYYKGPQVLNRPSSGLIPPGSMLKAKLVSGASNGSVKAIAVSPLNFNGETLIPAGTTFWGQGQSSDYRLYIRFKKVIYKDGTVETVQAQAADASDKIAGLKGSKLGHYGWRLAGSVGLNMLGGLSEGLREQEVKNGVAVNKTDFKNAALGGAAHATIDLSREIMSSLKNKKPMIVKKAGSPIYIIFEGE